MNEPGFYVVWCVGGGSPTVQHVYRSDAEREARRLASMSPGKTFAVLRGEIAFVKDDVKVINYDTGDMPIPF